LSVFTTLEAAVAPGGKAQVFDLELLEHPLHSFEDDVSEGGEAGHIGIAPVAPDGRVDLPLLFAWAATRGTGRAHPLTVQLRNALVRIDLRRPR
jgi:hypothetical protein